MDFTAKTALVTGAGHGIGEATALAYAARGANVAIIDLDAEGAQSVANRIDPSGARTMVCTVDITDTAAVRIALHEIRDRFGSLDVLANVAAIYPGSRIPAVTEDLWDQVMGINVRGLFFCTQEALNIMEAQGSGAIVNIASGAAFRPLEGQIAYCTSKAALVGMSRVLALEYAQKGVRVNVVAPGHTLSEHAIETIGADRVDAMAADLPSGRFMTPDEIANAIVWVSSDAASGLNGAILNVNGGSFML